MAKQYKVAVVGNRDAILPFKMIGFETFPVNTADETKKTLRQLENDEYGIVYLTEDFAQEIPDIIQYYDTVVTPAVILFPPIVVTLALVHKKFKIMSKKQSE